MTTADELFVLVMHRFSEVFEEHAIIKGGIALRLLDSPRSTTDIDYVFVPYGSKKDLVEPVVEALTDLTDDIEVRHQLHSKMLRVELVSAEAAIQVEITAQAECRSTPMATGSFAHAAGRPSQIVRVMDQDVALAHKLAAWNERRLLRDLFDVYFMFGRVGAVPDGPTLDARLAKVQSRLPMLRKKKRMTREEFVQALAEAAAALAQDDVRKQLAPLLPPAELAGLALRMRTQLRRLIEQL